MDSDTQLLLITLLGNLMVVGVILTFFKELMYYRGDMDNQLAKK